MDEFELIERYFRRAVTIPAGSGVELGIGDDAAVLKVPAGHRLVVSVDTLVAGRHFVQEAEAGTLGYKALAVGLSDLAAMGATPCWYWLALTLPAAEARWLEAFAASMHALARRYDMVLAGGNLARGPLAICITVAGLVRPRQVLRRDGATAGDAIYVSGELGAAALALQAPRAPVERLCRPKPRVELGLALAGLASACIDVSDGFGADLGHLLTASGVGATLDPAALPLPAALVALPQRERAWQLAISGGDDYELCFTVPSAREEMLRRQLSELDVRVTRVGKVESRLGLRWRLVDGRNFQPTTMGYLHFGDIDTRAARSG